ncbi:hypothetical protein BC332_33557 [Capsicum chinense]|nr:hypothetical protein BC332_33557 [Capsicum chinense]
MIMSSNFQVRHFYQVPPNYYVSRYIGGPHTYNGQSWFDNIEDPYLRDFYATTMNYDTGCYYYYHPTSGYVDDHVYVAADDQFPSIVCTNSQSHRTYNGQSSFNYIDNPYLWDDAFNRPTGEIIDGVYVIDESEFINQALGNYHSVLRNIGDHYFAPHNSALTGPGNTYNGQSSFDNIEDPDLWDDIYNQSTGESIDGVYHTTESEFSDEDYDTTGSRLTDDATDLAILIELLQLLVANVVEGSEDGEEATEETLANMMKTRTHCGTDDGGETCAICLCEYENDEAIGTLECQHEYHARCIKQWLLKGKRSCPLCRSSVFPS